MQFSYLGEKSEGGWVCVPAAACLLSWLQVKSVIGISTGTLFEQAGDFAQYSSLRRQDGVSSL